MTDKRTHILHFIKCRSEADLDKICDDLTKSGGEVLKRSIKEEKDIGFVSVTMDTRYEVDFWMAFKKTDSMKYMNK